MTYSTMVELTETRTAFFTVEAPNKASAEQQAKELARTEQAAFTCEHAIEVNFLEEDRAT